jgi:hypothetical protein
VQTISDWHSVLADLHVNEGVTIEALRAEVNKKRPERNQSEKPWQFFNRLTNTNGGKPAKETAEQRKIREAARLKELREAVQ